MIDKWNMLWDSLCNLWFMTLYLKPLVSSISTGAGRTPNWCKKRQLRDSNDSLNVCLSCLGVGDRGLICIVLNCLQVQLVQDPATGGTFILKVGVSCSSLSLPLGKSSGRG